MGDDSQNGTGPGGVLEQGGQASYNEEVLAASLQKLVLTPLEEAMKDAGLEEVEMYVLSTHNTIVQYIATRIILDLCE